MAAGQRETRTERTRVWDLGKRGLLIDYTVSTRIYSTQMNIHVM